MGCGQSTSVATSPSPAELAVVPTPSPQQQKTTNNNNNSNPLQPSPSVTTQTGSSTSNSSSSQPAPASSDLAAAAELEKTLRLAASNNAMATDQKQEAAWKSFSPEKLAEIEAARAAVAANGPLVLDPKANYGLICRACTKPNSINVDFCTGCSFPSTKWDIQRLPDNIFYLLVKGEDIGAVVRYRDDGAIVFDDKYPVSDNHLDVIPTEVYADITVLDASHIPLLERLYELGRAEFQRRNIWWLQGENVDEFITAGYNFPVSVKHLHLHTVLPPFRHERVFQYPRWHSHTKVVRDLKQHGRVQLYSEQPDDDEGAREYQRVLDNWERAKQLMKKAEEEGRTPPKSA